VDIVQNPRNPTGTVHSGNSGRCETGETASAPHNQPQADEAMATKCGSSPGTGAGMRCEGCGNACRVARYPLKVQ
jgi:hypothetical protein